MARVYDGAILDENAGPLTDHKGEPITDGTIIITDIREVGFDRRKIESTSFKQRQIKMTLFKS